MDKEYWRLLDFEYDNPHMNLALEEAIMKCVGRESAPCTLRFWKNSRAVVIGSFQSAELEVDLKACEAWKVPVIRRITGGGAVYHDEGNLNYSLFLLNDHPLVSKNFNKVFESVSLVVAEALCLLGLEAEHAVRNTILVGKKKISGLAGAMRSGAILVHGSLLINSDLRSLYEVLGFNQIVLKASGKRRFTRSQRMEVITLEEALGNKISLPEVKRVLVKAFEGLFSVKFLVSSLNESEEILLKELFEQKYNLKNWNYKYAKEHSS